MANQRVWIVIRPHSTLALHLATAILAVSLPALAGAAPVRERVRLDNGWRFHKGDPADAPASLIYDVRPVVTEVQEGQPADTPAQAAEKLSRSGQQVLKPWILPSGNRFILDPARRHRRPAGDPGGNVSFVRAGFDDTSWQSVTLPHDWAITGPFLTTGPHGGMGRLPSWGVGWYRRTLDVPARDRGKSVFLDVDGAMAYASVWLNGHLVGGWPYGYNSWRLDLTPYIRPGGTNQLAIRLDNPPDSARWYPGGGLYRDVWLTKTAPVHVGQWGTSVTTTNVSPRSANVALAVTVDNDADQAAMVQVSTDIFALDAAGRRTGGRVAHMVAEDASIPAKGSGTLRASVVITNPRLWGPPPTQQPNRYVALTTVRRGGRRVDQYETRFGIRTIGFDGNRGVIVNGEPVDLKGVNNHHDLGALGAAFNTRAAERQLEELREMGANAIRMSHNPPAPELLDLADRMGFLVFDEIFDAWERKKTPLDYHLIFPDWYEPDLRSMLRRDRNHPSIFIWGVGNEVGEQYTGEEGAAIGRKLVDIVHQEDPTRPATSAMNAAKPDMALPKVMDVISLNYQGTGVRTLPGQFQPFHDAYPDKVILSSESASALSSRGEYLFPVPGTISGPVRPGVGGDPDRQQVSSYELFAADFGSSPDRVFSEDDQHPFTAGEFVWTGWDYLGEPTPYYGARSSYSGIIDLAGFRKDRFYAYQARWRPELRMAHILPHWTWPGREGQVTPVHVFTAADEAELFVNGTSQGRLKRAPFQYRFRWDYVTYQPGELKVVTYKDGKEWATDTVRTAGAPARLTAEADRTTIAADGRDLSFIKLSITDKDGLVVPRASDTISFTVDGPGEIVGTDNGDPTSFVPFQSHQRPAFNGHALVIVRARPGGRGPITVRASAPSITGATATVRVVPAPPSGERR